MTRIPSANLVRCDDCHAQFPARRARQFVEQACRTVGAGGTNSDVRLQRKTGRWICDPCVVKREIAEKQAGEMTRMFGGES